jgi:lysophospholipase L1-like esterase
VGGHGNGAAAPASEKLCRHVDGASRFYQEDGSVRYAEGRRFFYTDDDHLNDTGAAEISDLLQQSLPAR